MAGRRIEGNFNQGWGVAAFITLLAVAGFATAFMVNRRYHDSPNDVTAERVGGSGGGSHAPAPAAAPVKH